MQVMVKRFSVLLEGGGEGILNIVTHTIQQNGTIFSHDKLKCSHTPWEIGKGIIQACFVSVLALHHFNILYF